MSLTDNPNISATIAANGFKPECPHDIDHFCEPCTDLPTSLRAGLPASQRRIPTAATTPVSFTTGTRTLVRVGTCCTLSRVSPTLSRAPRASKYSLGHDRRSAHPALEPRMGACVGSAGVVRLAHRKFSLRRGATRPDRERSGVVCRREGSASLSACSDWDFEPVARAER